MTRAKERGSEEINDAIDYSRAAIAFHSVSQLDRFKALTLKGRAHFVAFQHAKTIAYLKDSLTCYSEAVELCPHTHPLRYEVLTECSEALLQNFKDWGKREDLDRVFELLREALPLCPSESEDSARISQCFGTAYAIRFSQDGTPEDLDKSIIHHSSALEVRKPGHRTRHLSLCSLADTYAKRFNYTGDPEHLDTAILYCHEALNLHPPEHPDDSAFLTQLSNACLQRYNTRGNAEDLDRSIRFQREALNIQREGLVHRFSSLSNLGRALSIRFELRRDAEDAEDAIKYHNQALMFYPRGHPERHLAFSDRGKAYLNRYELSNDVEDLEGAVKDHEQALALCPSWHPWYGQSLYNLADALLARFSKMRQQKDITTASEYLQSARSLLHQDDPSLGLVYFASAKERLLQAVRSADPLVVDEGFAFYQKASFHRTLGTRQQLNASLRWIADAEEHRHATTLLAYRRAFVLLDQQLNVVSDVLTRHLLRKQLPSNLATNAAACAIDEGENDVAVELLEQGRGLLWMQLTRLRAPLDDLRNLGPAEAALADEFEKLSKKLEAGATTVASIANTSEVSEVAREQDAQKYREVSERWEAVVAQIRQVPSFTHFLQTTPYSELREAAKAGPVVVINISQRRSDALVVLPSGSPYIIFLPQATPRALASLSFDLTNILKNTRAAEDEKYRTSQVTRTLRQLWDMILSPVVQYLSTVITTGSRIWLCPTVELCSLPIHAAGQYRKGGSNLPDTFVCSYTPTLTALIRARRVTSAIHIGPAVLAISERNEDAGAGETILVSASQEVEELKKLVPKSLRHSELLDNAATPEAVLQALRDHTWVHFACHGVQEPAQPFYSHFLLHGKPLRLLDIIQAELDHVQFAFTSACHTAVGDKDTPDEVIHLAAALQFAGFRSVVGTIWGMDDRDGPVVMKEFYQTMFNSSRNLDHTEAAIALNTATKAMKKKGVPIDRRGVFIHIGA